MSKGRAAIALAILCAVNAASADCLPTIEGSVVLEATVLQCEVVDEPVGRFVRVSVAGPVARIEGCGAGECEGSQYYDYWLANIAKVPTVYFPTRVEATCNPFHANSRLLAALEVMCG